MYPGLGTLALSLELLLDRVYTLYQDPLVQAFPELHATSWEKPLPPLLP